MKPLADAIGEFSAHEAADSRLPIAAALLSMAIAVIDDPVAIVVIAMSYASDLASAAWVAAGAALALRVAMNRCGVTHASASSVAGWLHSTLQKPAR